MSLMYLEDYLELVSFLPQEFRERLTKVRELDLESSNRRDNIEKLKKQLQKAGRTSKADQNVPEHSSDSLTPNDRANIVAEIEMEYDKIVQLGVEKAKLVAGLEEMMIRYNKRLTTDTEKFKLELEADNPGITESLEAKAEAEMKNLYEGGSKVLSTEVPRNLSSRRIADMGTIAAMRKQGLLQGQGGGAGVLARAATQAIAATQQMSHGRRTASLKASYEAAVRSTPTGTSRAVSTEGEENPARGGRKRGSRASRKAEVDTETEDTGTDTQDDDKLTYCFCKNPSFGFMVACDNPSCPIEWFHGSCVNVTAEEVEGKNWYCPDCVEAMKREKKYKAVRHELSKMDLHSKQDASHKSKKNRKPQ
ncbi:inhibitor of growth protein 3-like [Paramacrobiotus metropolitanus]|uniref:inhibitor of growth protein 3-like n=1 Tax=Paramacrobiotus metropolitanus TaxID=2943436 RepID=UPI00244625C5|nr:inhibitor of growth protein 3-like [Paramacrobiotus metropolitanus]